MDSTHSSWSGNGAMLRSDKPLPPPPSSCGTRLQDVARVLFNQVTFCSCVSSKASACSEEEVLRPSESSEDSAVSFPATISDSDMAPGAPAIIAQAAPLHPQSAQEYKELRGRVISRDERDSIEVEVESSLARLARVRSLSPPPIHVRDRSRVVPRPCEVPETPMAGPPLPLSVLRAPQRLRLHQPQNYFTDEHRNLRPALL